MSTSKRRMGTTYAAERALSKRYCSTCQTFYPPDQTKHECRSRQCACGCGTVLVRRSPHRPLPKWVKGHHNRVRPVVEERYYVVSLSGYDGGTSGKNVMRTEFNVLDRCYCHRVVATYGPHSSAAKTERARREARWDADRRNSLERQWEQAA